MVFYSINEVIEGMVVAESIYADNGRLMITAGFQIKQTITSLICGKRAMDFMTTQSTSPSSPYA
jgi:hypothetical protein